MATAAALTIPHGDWTEDRIETVVLDLLADLLNEDRQALEDRLRDKGDMLPIDSLDLFDVLLEFRQQTGITLNKRRLGRQAMRSVRAFAQFAMREAQQ